MSSIRQLMNENVFMKKILSIKFIRIKLFVSLFASHFEGGKVYKKSTRKKSLSYKML